MTRVAQQNIFTKLASLFLPQHLAHTRYGNDATNRPKLHIISEIVEHVRASRFDPLVNTSYPQNDNPLFIKANICNKDITAKMNINNVTKV